MSALRDTFVIPSIKCSVCGADVEISLMGDHICAPKQEELSLSGFLPHSHSLPQQQLPVTDAGSANQTYNQSPPSGSNFGFRAYPPATPRNGRPLEILPHPHINSESLAVNKYSLSLYYESPILPPDGLNYPSIPSATRFSYGVRGPGAVSDDDNVQTEINTSASEALALDGQNRGRLSGTAHIVGRKYSIEQLPATISSVSNDNHYSLHGRETFESVGFGSEDLDFLSASTEDLSEFSGSGDWSRDALPRSARSDIVSGTQALAPETSGLPRKNEGTFGHRANRSEAAGRHKVEPEPPSPLTSITFAIPEPKSAAQVPPHPGMKPLHPPAQTKNVLLKDLRKALPPPPPEPQIFVSELHPNRRDSSGQGGYATHNRAQDAPPARPRPPPSTQRLLSEGLPHDYSRKYPFQHSATLSTSSDASSAFSNLSKSSMSSPPSSDISLTSRTRGPKFVDPKTFDHEQHKHYTQPSGAALIDNPHLSMDGKSLPRRKSREDALEQRSQSVQSQRTERAGSHEARQTPSPSQRDTYEQPQQSLPPPEHQQQPDYNYTPRASPPSEYAQNQYSSAKSPHPTRGHNRTQANKGPCRGCGETIFGKSISSVDGRLTGRYHKQCFACQECQEPFQTAEFYVLSNLPYCERHYHELNHSLCLACGRGIEGPCLETVRDERFHVDCFTCTHCRCILGEDYFEINSRPFCELHAGRLVQGPSPHTRPPYGAGPHAGRPPPPGMRAPPPRGYGPAPRNAPTGTLPVSTRSERRKTRMICVVPGIEVPHIPGMGSRYPVA